MLKHSDIGVFFFVIVILMSQTQEFIESVLTEASHIANANFGKVSGSVKPEDNNQVLTETDIEIGNLIVSRVTSHFPDWNVIDEEAGVIDNGSPYTWVIDPIDGTSNFANGIHTYGIMMGILKDDVPIAGGISLPFFNELYVAEKDMGTTCNGEVVRVNEEKSLLNALVAYGIDGHQENPQLTIEETTTLAQIILSVRNLRSSNSAYDAALVANGKYGAWLNRTSKIWDNVAQQIVIEEAGGTYTDFFGKPMDYSNATSRADYNFTVCAASPELHKQLQAIIHNLATSQS
jgi:myo-inositol-1(or 4)-monophosphatase